MVYQALTSANSGKGSRNMSPERVPNLPRAHVYNQTLGALGASEVGRNVVSPSLLQMGVGWAEGGEQAHPCASASEIPLRHIRGAASGQAEGGQRRAGCGRGSPGPGREHRGRPPRSSFQSLPAAQHLQPAPGSVSWLRASGRGRQWAVEALSWGWECVWGGAVSTWHLHDMALLEPGPASGHL